MTESCDDRQTRKRAVQLSDEYTYRAQWSEEDLGFNVSCDEMRLTYIPCVPYAEHLLDVAQYEVVQKLVQRLKSGVKLPRPTQPSKAAEVTKQSMANAMRQSLKELTPFDVLCESVFTVEEQRIINRLHWSPSEIAYIDGRPNMSSISDGQMIHLVDDARCSLAAVLMNVAAQQRDLGDEAGAAATNRMRYEMEDEYCHLDLNDPCARIDATRQYLHQYAKYLPQIYAGEPYWGPNLSDDERWNLLTAKPTLAILRDYCSVARRSCMQLAQILCVNWPWASMMTDMPRGWAMRFGAELIEDMQSVIDLGLDGFQLEQVKEKWGGLRIYFDDDPWNAESGEERDEQWMGVAEFMHVLLRCYENLSIRTCMQCGSWRDVRVTNGGWIYPICRRCQHTDIALQRVDARVWESMVRTTSDNESLTDWVHAHMPLVYDSHLRHAHIHDLLQICDEESRLAA